MSLKEELNALRLKGESRRSPDVVANMHRAVDELRRSGAADRVLEIGDKMPDFALPNANEQIVESKALLAKGPLVLTFYRGRW